MARETSERQRRQAANVGVSWVASRRRRHLLAIGDGDAKGKANKARFDLPAFNALYQKQKSLPNGPERLA